MPLQPVTLPMARRDLPLWPVEREALALKMPGARRLAPGWSGCARQEPPLSVKTEEEP